MEMVNQNYLTKEEFKELMLNSTDKIELIDVRTPEEYYEGFIKSAKNIPLNTITNYTPNKEKIVIVYCRTNNRSRVAYNYLKEKFPEVEIYYLIDGFIKFQNDDLVQEYSEKRSVENNLNQ